MQSELMISASDVALAIRGAYRSSHTCRCETVPKLGADELFEILIARRILPEEAVYGVNAVPIDSITEEELNAVGLHKFTFTHHFERLDELLACTKRDLRRLPNWGQVKVQAVERLLARRGLLLRDGDPSIIERVAAEDAEQKDVAEIIAAGEFDTETMVYDTVEGLMALGKSMMNDAQLLMSSAAKLALRLDDGRQSRTYYLTILKRYAYSQGRACAAEVARIVSPMLAWDDARKAKKPARARKRREQQTDERPALRLVAAE